MSQDVSDSCEQLKWAVSVNKTRLIQNLNVKDFLMSSFSWKDIISEDQQSQILSSYESGKRDGAAEDFIDALLTSTDPTTWSVFRDVLENNKDLELVKDILYNGETESLKAHEEETHMVQLMRGSLVETMDSAVLSEELRSKDLLSTSDYEEVQAKRHHHGNTMANYAILLMIVRRKRFYKKFLKILDDLEYHAVSQGFQHHYGHKIMDSDEESEEHDSSDDNSRGAFGFQVPSSDKKINNFGEECNNLDDGPVASRTRSKTKLHNINENVETEVKATYRESKTLPQVNHDIESYSMGVYDNYCPDVNLLATSNDTACVSVTQLKTVSNNPITSISQPETGNIYLISTCPLISNGYGSILGQLAQPSERYSSPLVSDASSSENWNGHVESITPSRENHDNHKVSMILPDTVEKRQPLLTIERHCMTLDSPKTTDFADKQNHDRKQKDPKLKITEREKDHLKEETECPQNSKTSTSMSEQKNIKAFKQKNIKAVKQTHHKDLAEGQRLNFIASDMGTSNSQKQLPKCSCGRQFGSEERLKNHQMNDCINALKSPGFHPREIQDQDGSQIIKKYATKHRKTTNFKQKMKAFPISAIEENSKASFPVAGQKTMAASAEKHERRRDENSDSDDSETKTWHDMKGARPKEFLTCSCGKQLVSKMSLEQHQKNECMHRRGPLPNRSAPTRSDVHETDWKPQQNMPMARPLSPRAKSSPEETEKTMQLRDMFIPCSCGMKFKSREALKFHKDNTCRENRQSPERINSLQMTHSKTKAANDADATIKELKKCSSCLMKFNSMERLLLHQKSECSELRKRQERVSSLPRSDLVHVKQSVIPNLFPCSCGAKFISHESLQKHQNSDCKNKPQSSQTGNINSSSRAQQSSLSRSDLVNVEQSVIPNLFPCSCGAKFISHESLQKHQNSDCKDRPQSSQSRNNNNSSQAQQSSAETNSTRNRRLGFQSPQTLKLEKKTDKTKDK